MLTSNSTFAASAKSGNISDIITILMSTEMYTSKATKKEHIFCYTTIKLKTEQKFSKTSDLSNVLVQQVHTVVKLILLSAFSKQWKSTSTCNNKSQAATA